MSWPNSSFISFVEIHHRQLSIGGGFFYVEKHVLTFVTK